MRNRSRSREPCRPRMTSVPSGNWEQGRRQPEGPDILAWEDVYLRDGHFNQNRMLALIEQVLIDGKAQGFLLTRLVADMEWALQDRPGVEDLVEYETRLNYVLPKYDDAVV